MRKQKKTRSIFDPVQLLDQSIKYCVLRRNILEGGPKRGQGQKLTCSFFCLRMNLCPMGLSKIAILYYTVHSIISYD